MNRLHALADGLWILAGDPIAFLGFPYDIRATVVRLDGGDLLVHSPVQVSALSALAALPGAVKYIVTPNKLHHVFLADWQRALPAARLYAPPGLRGKRPDLQFVGELGERPAAAWSGTLEQTLVRGSLFMTEVVFFHRASRTLILGDLIENHDPARFGVLQRSIARCNAMLAPRGSTPRNFRWTFLRRDALRRDLDVIAAWNPARVVVAHGPIVEQNAAEFLAHAFRWARR
ncbi:MAG: DUF4336 domain-containing protein [Gammaproteobacteria bacterium]|nr:DUF4336 domain-containing protein [Gammaproteobacteria bacterium]MCP5201502.1 DUF4336 domain-containing protein [Gammaproteobacteria bacterium]